MDTKLNQEQQRREELAVTARKIVEMTLAVEDANESAVMLGFNGFYLQIAFSPLHPLMVFLLARALEHPDAPRLKPILNELNLRGVLGSHAVNEEVGCYSYRASHWLDAELSQTRFIEMLDRCVDEATRGYCSLVETKKRRTAE